MAREVLIWLCVVAFIAIAALMYATKDFINWYGHWDEEDAPKENPTQGAGLKDNRR